MDGSAADGRVGFERAMEIAVDMKMNESDCSRW